MQIKDIHVQLEKGASDRYEKEENPKEVRDSCEVLLEDFERRQCTNRADGEGNFSIQNQEVVRGACNHQHGIHPFFTCHVFGSNV